MKDQPIDDAGFISVKGAPIPFRRQDQIVSLDCISVKVAELLLSTIAQRFAVVEIEGYELEDGDSMSPFRRNVHRQPV